METACCTPKTEFRQRWKCVRQMRNFFIFLFLASKARSVCSPTGSDHTPARGLHLLVTLKLLYALSADPYRRKTSSSAALKCEHLFRYAKHAQRVKQCGTRHLKQEEYNAWTTDDVKEKNSSFGVRTLLIAEVDGRRTTRHPAHRSSFART